MEHVDTRTSDSSGQTGAPPPKAQRGIGRGPRDMLLSMAAICAFVLVLLLVTGAVSFDPGGQDAKASGGAPTRHPDVVLNAAAKQVDFPLRNPHVPGSWHCNSADTGTVGKGSSAGEAVSIGWITPGRGYLKLAQAKTSAQALVRGETGAGSEDAVAKQGTVTVGEVTWTKYPGRRDETAWAASLHGVRIVLTGNATPEQFRTLASALPSAKVIQPRRPKVG
jgi:hypothetical protein